MTSFINKDTTIHQCNTGVYHLTESSATKTNKGMDSRFYTFLAVAIAAAVYYIDSNRANLPSHMLNHTAMWVEDLIPQEHATALNEIMREMAEFPSNVDADLKTGGFVARHEHIGEAEPIGEDGTCSHPFLVPDISRTKCILPQRIDIGRHFILTGGPDAIREPYEKMISRVSSFGRYMFQVRSRQSITYEVQLCPIFSRYGLVFLTAASLTSILPLLIMLIISTSTSTTASADVSAVSAVGGGPISSSRGAVCAGEVSDCRQSYLPARPAGP